MEVHQTPELTQIQHTLAKQPRAILSHPFGPEAEVYKIMGKMYALLQIRPPYRLTLKCKPDEAEILIDQFAGIHPGYHMNKRHWITLELADDVPHDLIDTLIESSYQLVVEKLPKSDQARLELA
ncbi:MmcQ/YjbR family DNA-binding protein [Ferrimonas pelagia]|uniref:MmcQ/YjbR family DNA-binding protein n=1 Tax=Ferrimonas pelagia TaxID=1177826 RepID=A0ABP9EM39_9GAMM